MNEALRARIVRIHQAYADWWALPPIPPATEESIGRVRQWYGEHLLGSLPDDLVAFWRTTNGIDLNGKVLWATEPGRDISGIVEVNALHVEDFGEHFFLGQSDDVWMYAYHPRDKAFRILGMHQFDHIEAQFETFDDLAVAVLDQAIQRSGLT